MGDWEGDGRGKYFFAIFSRKSEITLLILMIKYNFLIIEILYSPEYHYY